MSRDPERRPPKPKKRAVGGQIPDQGKGYVPALHYSLFTQSTGFGVPKRPCEKSKENHWGGHVRFPRSLESKLFSVGDICTISEPDTFYRGLKCTLREFLPFDQMWKVKLDMRTNIVKVSEQYLTLDKAAHKQAPDHAIVRKAPKRCVVHVKNTKDAPWGVAIPNSAETDQFNEGIDILKVSRGKQFEMLNIHVGWVIVAIQVMGESVVHTDKVAMRNLLQDGVECDITFDTSFVEPKPKAESQPEIIDYSENTLHGQMVECKRCGCSGYSYGGGYLFDKYYEKKCFCDSCCAHGCDAVKLTKRKRRQQKTQTVQRAMRKPKQR